MLLGLNDVNIDKIRKITINLTEREMNAIEDRFFCELNRKQYMKIRPILGKVWKKLCRKMDKYSED